MVHVPEEFADALRPEYEIEREIDSGGMGTVYLARDVALDRPVAIKVMRPEIATAVAAERFLREAQILASLRHPNVMPVHRAGRAAGIPYYVMDYFDGETLAHRLARGPLAADAAHALGRDLLAALVQVHRAGVVHRDIKPENIFLMDARAVLADFGVAKAPSREALTDEGLRVGTPRYWAPEQELGLEVTPRTDLYAVGLVLYQALTGRRWPRDPDDGPADWSGVPRGLVPALRRALAPDPADRWDDAESFAAALTAAMDRRRRQRAGVFVALAFAFGVAVAILFYDGDRNGRHPVDLAILPFAVADPGDDATGRWLAKLAHTSIDTALTLVPISNAFEFRPPRGAPPESLAAVAAAALTAGQVASGTVSREGDTLVVDLQVTDRDGTVRPARVRGAAGDLVTLGYQIGLQLVRIVSPQRVHAYPPEAPITSTAGEAILEYLRGDDAFHANRWQVAVEHFSRALADDPTFVLAASALSNAYRWLGTGEPHPGLDLAAIRARYRGTLNELDRLILDAQLASTAGERFGIYHSAVEKYPRDGYVAFLYGEELLHRGPFVGVPLEDAIAELEAAVAKDSTLAPALDHLVWAYLRLGRRDAARRRLDQLARVAAAPEATQLDAIALLELAFTERFAPADSVRAMRGRVLAEPRLSANVTTTLRLGLAFGLPLSQAELGALLLGDPRQEHAALGHLHQARGLALIALGRMTAALAHLDSAATLLDSDEARLQPAEWRVIPAAFGLPGIPPAEREAGRDALRRFALGHGALALRAAWALGLDAAAARDTVAARRWLARAAADAPGAAAPGHLARLLHSAVEAAAGRYHLAVAGSEALLATDSAGRIGDPFGRAALHLARGEWLDSLGQALAADSARRWYEHYDWIGFPSGAAQAAEIDWALGSFAQWVRGEAARRRGDRRAACRQLDGVLPLWRQADSAFASLHARASAFVARSCPS